MSLHSKISKFQGCKAGKVWKIGEKYKMVKTILIFLAKNSYENVKK